jgi:hypothetical protein
VEYIDKPVSLPLFIDRNINNRYDLRRRFGDLSDEAVDL